MKKRERKGELNLSFGMIFSIILIIAFLVFAFYAIRKFLEFQDTINIEKFKAGLQTNIDDLWRSSGNEEGYGVSYNLPKKITGVCFKDDEFENLYFQSERIITGKKIEHLDIIATLNGKDSVCFENTNGKVNMTLNKDFSDVLVTISE
ncbi:MAG: hypothetical protein Q7S06_01235 [Nanoarchaeota archaeon]|nr:hypothetical protein [Nanoarchaeota archaeon]